MPDLHGFPGNNLLNHTAPRLQNPSSSNPHSQLPSFPVSVIQNREGSPTKSIFGTSPNGTTTVGVGRRSPIHDMQMDSIAEDSTEDSATPTEVNPPVSIAMVVSNHSPPSPRLGVLRRASVGDRSAAMNAGGGLMMPAQGQTQQQVSSRPTTPSSLQAGDNGEPRRRRSGAISPALQEQIQASIQENSHQQQQQQQTQQQQGEQLQLQALLQNGRNHHHIMNDASQILASPKSSPMSQGLMSMLQSPLPNNPQPNAVPMNTPHIAENGQLIHMAGQQSSSLAQGVPQINAAGFLYANALNHFNGVNVAAAFHPAVMPTHHHALMQPNSPFHQPALSQPQPQQPNPAGNVQDVLSHVSSVLNHCGIRYHHSNGVFAIDHQGVRLHILVCHLASQQNAIQLQYVAGDASQYQNLCSHLYNRLTATTLAAQ